MLFNSYIFIFLFLPITVVTFYWLAAQFGPRISRVWLVGSSLFYYAWWNPSFLALLVASLVFNYGLGMMLTSAAKPRRKKQVLFGGVVVNLAALGYFKYANWFIDNINGLIGSEWTLENVLLPLGISFFTFQQIAFLCDAEKGETREYQFLDYCLFVTFFPQLIAGPIVHHREMMPQFAKAETYRLHWENISVGLTLFTIGLFKKVVIADGISGYSTAVFSAAQMRDADPSVALSTLDAWSGALAFTFQIYFDFSGYCDMALGLGRLFGIRLPMNFFSPYKATSIIEFWRRWHITLSRFLRDYIYIPLGGNRKGPVRRYINLLLTMLLGGLWHGAGWTFVIWGGLHGLYLCANHLWRSFVMPHQGKTPVAARLVSVCITFLFVTLAWVFFRAESLEAAKLLLQAMFGMQSGATGADASNINSPVVFVWLAILAAAVWFLPNAIQMLNTERPCYEVNKESQAELPRCQRWLLWKPNSVWAIATSLTFIYCLLSLTKVSEFLYFNF
jgi:alginate O-acetyltransferase complex protein AlgI